MEGGGLGFYSGAPEANIRPIRGSFKDNMRLRRTGPYTPDTERRHQRTDAKRSLRDIVEAASVKASSSVAALLQPLVASTKNTVARVLAGTSPRIPLTEGPPPGPEQQPLNTSCGTQLPSTSLLLSSQQEQRSSAGVPGADEHAAHSICKTAGPPHLPNSNTPTGFPAGQRPTDFSDSIGKEIGHTFAVPVPRRVAGAGALRASFPSNAGKFHPVGHPVFRSIDGSCGARPCGGASQHASVKHIDMPTLQQRCVRPSELSSIRDDIIGPLDNVLDAYLGGMRCQVDELERGARKRRRILEESIQAKLVQQPSPLPRRLLATRFPAIAPSEAPKPAMDAWPSRPEASSNDGLELSHVADGTAAAAQHAVVDKPMPQHGSLATEEEKEVDWCHTNEATISACKTDANDSPQKALLSQPTRKDIVAVHQQEDAGSIVATIVRDSASPMSGASALAQGTNTQQRAEGAAEDVVKVETREDFWRVQIEAIYRRRNTFKLAEVPQLLAKHRGHEASLYCKICRRYDLNPKLLYADPNSWEAEDKDIKDDDDANCHASSPPVEVNTAMTVNPPASVPLGGRADQGASLFGLPDSASCGISGGSSLFGGTQVDIGTTQSSGLSGGFLFGGSIGTGHSDVEKTNEEGAGALPASSTSGTSIFGATVSGASSAIGTGIFASSAISSSTSGLAFPGSSSLETGSAVTSIFGAGNSAFNFSNSSSSSSSSSSSNNIFKEGLQGNDSIETMQPRHKADKEVMAKRRIVRAKRSRPAVAEAVPVFPASLGSPAQALAATPPQPSVELTGTVPFKIAESAEAATVATGGGSSVDGASSFAGMAAAGRQDSAANCEDKQLQVAPSSLEEKPGEGDQTGEGEKPIAVESKYDFWKVQIEAIYRRRNPHKMNDVPKLLDKYKDNEVTLYRKVCLRYDLDSNKLYADPAAWEGEEKDVKDDDDEAAGTTASGTSGSGAMLFGAGMGSVFGSHASSSGLFGGQSTGSSSLFSIQAHSTGSNSNSCSSGGLFGSGSSFTFGAGPCSSGVSGSIGSGLFAFGAGATASTASFGVGGFSATANTATGGRSGLFGVASENSSGGAGLAGSAGSSLFGSGGLSDEGASKRKRRFT
mmetsp:Transcript_78900/g.156275  ORF Transcript_78900/g.156275 Transcript_78900/m.156275 type:complete len:1110 (+) Transcript_78900:71-3400(+)